MKVGFPHMGNFYIAFEALLKNLGPSVIVPPRPTRKSIELGVKHSPEFICFPFKATLGDLIYALESGADTLAWFEGEWSCRFGYYGRLHHQILRDLGYKFKSLLFSGGELVRGVSQVNKVIKLKIPKVLRALRIAWQKSSLVKLTESLGRRIRPYAINPRDVSRLEGETLRIIRKAETSLELKGLKSAIVNSFDLIPKDDKRRPLRVMMVGEIYMVLQPEANFDIAKYLGEHGVFVKSFTTIHNWMFRSLGSGKHGEDGEHFARNLAIPYLPYCLGGEEQLSIGYTILAKRWGYDGVVHLKPFTCMTENVAYPIIEKIGHEFDIPVLSFSLDEHTESVGFFTRVEAFLELLRQRRATKRASPGFQ